MSIARFNSAMLIALCALLLAASQPAISQPAQMRSKPSDAHTVRDLSGILRTLAAQDKFSGAVLLAKNNTVLFQGAYGYADHAFNVKNGVDTKFNMGSMGKMFTGVAILQLAQAGKISLDDKLISDLPAYPNRAVAQSVTIRQLLTHTSGLGDFFGPAFAAANMGRLDTLESLLPFFVHKPLLFRPGSKWSYSNAGYIVLGLVIQRVSGQSYYDYVQKHIFDPAGMHDTGNWPADADVPNRALGYTTMSSDGSTGAVRKSNIFMLQRGGSAGGGYSTVHDLLRFAQALQQHTLLNERYSGLAMSGQVATGRPGIKYGFGMEEQTVGGTHIVGHSGGGPGIESVLQIYPSLGYVVAIMTNYDHAMSAVSSRLRAELSGQTIPQAIASTQSMSQFVGRYSPVLPPGMQNMTPPPITVTAESKGLKVDPGMGPAFHFVPVAKDEFVDADSHALHITFLRDGNRRITGLKTATGFGPVPPITATKA